MGLTFLAWANSVGDLVADISLAKVGKAKTAVAACFGTPLLNLLVGLGLGCLIAILTVPGREDGVALFVSPGIPEGASTVLSPRDQRFSLIKVQKGKWRWGKWPIVTRTGIWQTI